MTELKRVSDEARQSQEDALIRQEVALRRLFDGERRAWQEEKGQLMMLIGSLQKEIAERSEARAHAETMARKMAHVVGSLEKSLLQVEQGAQDEIRKLRAALMMGGGGGGLMLAAGGNGGGGGSSANGGGGGGRGGGRGRERFRKGGAAEFEFGIGQRGAQADARTREQHAVAICGKRGIGDATDRRVARAY